MRYFSVKNFERFQHYKSGAKAEGKPRWIKLYLSVLTDYDLSLLPDSAKAHLYNLWALAGELNNKIPWDPKWLAHKINASSPINLDLLEQSGFISALEGFPKSGIEGSDESQSLLLSSDLISSSGKDQNPKDDEDDPNAPITPEELMEGWNVVAQSGPFASIREITKQRMEKCRARIKEHPVFDWWKVVFANIQTSGYLHQPEHHWFSFDWLIENSNNVVKVYEGRYAAKTPATRNGNGRKSDGLSSLLDLQQKHGEPE